jgi:hypothetical protein
MRHEPRPTTEPPIANQPSNSRSPCCCNTAKRPAELAETPSLRASQTRRRRGGGKPRIEPAPDEQRGRAIHANTSTLEVRSRNARRSRLADEGPRARRAQRERNPGVAAQPVPAREQPADRDGAGAEERPCLNTVATPRPGDAATAATSRSQALSSTAHPG